MNSRTSFLIAGPGVRTARSLPAVGFDRRLFRPAAQLAGITGSDRLPAGIPVRDVRGMKTGRRSFAPTPATKEAICRYLAGATGLEPATSGVTGRRSNQ